MALHSMEERLLNRCQELNLKNEEKEILRDLFGWNNRNGDIPISYGSIEPQHSLMLAVGTVGEKEVAMAKTLSNLLRKLIGNDEVFRAEIEPVETLQNRLGLHRLSVVWLVCQLKLAEAYEELVEEARLICLKDPQMMACQVALPTIAMLLKKAK